jgi:glycolate dehydrogenase FAD-linked subunit
MLSGCGRSFGSSGPWHGVGSLKLDGMRRELGPVAVAMQRAVKRALDPLGILNPGKAVG